MREHELQLANMSPGPMQTRDLVIREEADGEEAQTHPSSSSNGTGRKKSASQRFGPGTGAGADPEKIQVLEDKYDELKQSVDQMFNIVEVINSKLATVLDSTVGPVHSHFSW